MPDPHWLSPTDPQTCSSTAYSKSSPDLAAPCETRPANVPARSCRTRSTRVLSPIAQCKGVLVCKVHRLTVKARQRLSPYSKCLNAYNRDAADMARATAATCGLSDESQSTRVIIAVSFFFVGTAVFVMLRTWSKLLTRTLYAEDHIITLAVTLAMAPFVCVLYSE